jgi:hypothetical protein
MDLFCPTGIGWASWANDEISAGAAPPVEAPKAPAPSPPAPVRAPANPATPSTCRPRAGLKLNKAK